MAKPPHPIVRLKADLFKLLQTARQEDLSAYARKRLDEELAAIMAALTEARRDLDRVKQPTSVFDPTDPRVVGRFVALALVAQPTVQLGDLGRFYGSGVYAIYYRGDYPPYEPLRETETPIYVGQAAPDNPRARNPMEQGEKLAGRLNDHRKNIEKAENLNLEDFSCRTLAVQSGFETAAEDYLIHLFEPIWNSETNLVYGLGKHGDAATTRGNRRSPWDTLHPGRKWAADASLQDARSPEQLYAQLEQHFTKTKVFHSLSEVLDSFINELKQF
ncbi:Eco29kI family restriction endonuclease [Sphingomonas arenae]|uniref:Eco29kI family restriction endonuclease n=1 Tax=Sphingomonas arenae TaxID=2812555 RepID=UPI001968A45A|nr:Eco29kI family restriction endonuclease [Sphingomonas arenae]